MQKRLAEGVIHQGKTFKQSAIDAGYSPKVGQLGPAFMRRRSVGVDMAFIEASKRLVWQPEDVKAIIRSRLIGDVTAGKSTGLERACELLGRDKSIDLWVRNGDIQLGIFNVLNETSSPLDAIPDDIIDMPDKE